MSSDRSEEQNQFGKGGEALDLEGDFNDSEEVDEEEEDPQSMMKAGSKKDGSGGKGPGQKDVKGKELENQPYDLAVDVNDSEEVESEEEDDEVNAMETGTNAAGGGAQKQNQ